MIMGVVPAVQGEEVASSFAYVLARPTEAREVQSVLMVGASAPVAPHVAKVVASTPI